jgi:hypothetical protein
MQSRPRSECSRNGGVYIFATPDLSTYAVLYAVLIRCDAVRLTKLQTPYIRGIVYDAVLYRYMKDPEKKSKQMLGSMVLYEGCESCEVCTRRARQTRR